MSKTEGFLILDTQNAAAGGDKAPGPNPRSVARRKLADISNIPQKMRPLIQDDKLQSIPTTAKTYIEQLQKDNMNLMKMLAQRNKLIEQSGIELERLRLNLIKVQEQNQQLALSRSQMLMELNLGKDRGEAFKVPCQTADAELPEEGETSTVSRDDEMPRTTKRRLRSQSFGSSEPLQSEENAGNRSEIWLNLVRYCNARPPARRQSARFKTVESKSAEDLSEKDNTIFPECPLPDESVLENGLTCGSASVKNEDNRRLSARRQSTRFKPVEPKSAEDQSEKDDSKFSECPLPDEPVLENESTSGSASVKYESQEIGRSSLSRPSRVAAKKVQSYKEVPLNVKMRRSE
ncbi:shugoshin-1 [Phtheirospermum japonicum]|uniref:Shugoshin-1 n=1 Tax=Phtheirospermum japonicum TaxID=374723 RepID=A0A830C9F3_9LAMI|nr:shugoshin-1 [Phtheirospermum japonicum]